MQIEILGSGGAVSTPRPGCHCRICVEARTKGVPYSRTEPSLFVHGPNVLVDTPEEIKEQLNRSRVTRIDGCFYSHWHPDHVLGRRVWESLNADYRHWPPQHRCTDIFLPQQVALDFRTHLGSWEQFDYMQRVGLVRLVELIDGEVVTLNGTTIRPFRLHEDYVYAFLLDDGDKRVLIAPDELFGWEPPEDIQGVDLAVIPMGIPKFHPLRGERVAPDEHPVFRAEATFDQTLDMARQLKAGHIVMTHIEEPTDVNYDEYLVLAEKLCGDGFNITFAYDTMLIDV